ncbi:hypothetical protein AYL99_04990 [Fonsecaea erecta]|uniref:Uncharacterized protein n=1 Tax=Fonsecaea erecta TaxID=1367422 RepID=A0A178ZJL0_9EURO|nr:hypothetical protein AYL99_04990 [Fonsecaea erecta]OAP59988.1 hypothetical protein AYL99_04990 [Fonsecaea erecta]
MSNYGSSNQATTRQGSGSGGGGSSVFYNASVSYSTSSSTSSSGSRSTGGDPQTRSHAQRYTETMTSNDRDGTNIRRVSEETGRPPRSEETYIPLRGGRVGASDDRGRIEDVTDADPDDDDQAARDREYEERMEDEYAKREGGA